MSVRSERHQLSALDGLELGWWRIFDTEKCQAEPRHMFMTHGTFSDRRICLKMARAWAELGHVAWILEWRGHGGSAKPTQAYDMEDVAKLDVNAALKWLAQRLPNQSICASTHSGGGLALTMALIHEPAHQTLISRMALYACQASDAGATVLRRLKLRLASYLFRQVGHIPGPKLRLGICDESYTMMKPWFQWNLTGKFSGRSGIDYGSMQAGVATAVMVIAGCSDHFIAPAEACRSYCERFQARQLENEFLICGKPFGFVQDYGHADVMTSKNASIEIFPSVNAWLLEAPVQPSAARHRQ